MIASTVLRRGVAVARRAASTPSFRAVAVRSFAAKAEETTEDTYKVFPDSKRDLTPEEWADAETMMQENVDKWKLMYSPVVTRYYEDRHAEEMQKVVSEPEPTPYLSDMRVQLPIAALVGISLVQNGVYVVTEETQLLGCFALFVATVYTQAGDAITKMLTAKGEAMLEEYKALDDQVLSLYDKSINVHKKRLDYVDDVNMLLQAKQDMMHRLFAARTAEQRHTIRDDMVAQLDFMLAQKRDVDEGFRRKTVSAIVDNFTKKLQDDAGTADAVLDEAIESLEKGAPTEDALSKFAAQHMASTEQKIKAGVTPERVAEIMADVAKNGNPYYDAFRKRFPVPEAQDGDALFADLKKQFIK